MILHGFYKLEFVLIRTCTAIESVFFTSPQNGEAMLHDCNKSVHHFLFLIVFQVKDHKNGILYANQMKGSLSLVFALPSAMNTARVYDGWTPLCQISKTLERELLPQIALTKFLI